MTLGTTLTSLEQAQILRRLGLAGEEDLGALYRFKHSLTQDAAYRSLPRRQRQQVHQRVAECYETLFAGRLDEHAAVLAYHYGEAGDQQKLLEYSQRAGDAALRVYATVEAVAHYEQAIGAALTGSQPAGKQLMYLYKQRGRALELASHHDEALAGYEQMERQAQALGFRDMELTAVISQALLRCTATVLFDAEAGRDLVVRALALAKELGDRASMARILWVRMNLHRLSGNQDQALKDGEASLAIARELDLREQAAYVLNDMTYILQGFIDQTRVVEVNAEATAYWRDAGNQPMLADSLAATVWSQYAMGNFNQALAASDEAHEISVRIGNVWGQSFSRMTTGLVYLETGELDRAWAAMNESLEKGEEAGFPVPPTMVSPQKALLLALLGDFVGAREVLRPLLVSGTQVFPESIAFTYVAWIETLLEEGEVAEAAIRLSGSDLGSLEESGVWGMVHGVGTMIRYHLATGDASLALDTANKHIATLLEMGLRAPLPDCLLEKAHALLALNRVEEARTSLNEALQSSRELGSRRVLWQIFAELAEITPDANEAARLRQEAAAVVAYLADHTPTPELRASFLALPDVRRVLG